jgi:hypothetical protein
MSDRHSVNKTEHSNSHSDVIVASIGVVGGIITTLIAGLISHAAGVTNNVFFPGTAAPQPTVTVTVTKSAGPLPIGTTVGSASFKNALLSARMIGSGMSQISTDAAVSQDTGICGAPPTGSTRSTASETFEETNSPSPGNATIFSERIIDWGNALEASQSITSDENALGQKGCDLTGSEATYSFGLQTTGTSPQECGSGNELTMVVSVSSSGSNSNSYAYNGFFIEAQCKTYTISIEDMANYYYTNAGTQADGYLNAAAGRLSAAIK